MLTEPISGARCPGSKGRNPSRSPGIKPYLSTDFLSSLLSDRFSSTSPPGAPLPQRLVSWTATQAHAGPGLSVSYHRLPTFHIRTQSSRSDLYVYRLSRLVGGTPRAALDPLLALFCCFQALQKLELFIWQDESTNYLKLLYAVPPLQFFSKAN